MANRPIFIRGCGDYYAPIADTPPELGPLVKQTLGAQVRRVGRFVQLALIGAARSFGDQPARPDTSVYLTSGRGDMEMTAEVMTQLYRDGMPPRPLSFINTVSNSACFYIAKQFGLRGRSSFVCNRYFSFESALQLATLDMELGVASSALVGSVDIVLAPLDVHRRRIALAPETPVAEASHWLRLEAGAAGENGPRLTSIETLADDMALLDWLRAYAGDPARAALAIGQFADEREVRTIAAKARVTTIFDYLDGRAYYDSQSGAAISAFLARPSQATTLLHVNQNAEGRFAAFAVTL
jgi:hypothetical protein